MGSSRMEKPLPLALKAAPESMDDERYTCAYCKNTLSDPIALPCLHSVCRRCLSVMYDRSEARSSGVVRCEECREDIDIPPETGIKAFPPNYFLNGMLSIHLAKTARDIRCKICELQGNDTFATHKCLNCGDFLCADCGKAHTFTRMTFEHHVRPLTELANGKRDKEMREKQTITCDIHQGEPVKYYCESCTVPICRECQLELHTGHACASAADSQKSRRKAIANMVLNVEQKLTALDSVEDTIDATLNDIDKREEDLIDGVNKTAKRLQDQIEREKTEILKSLKGSMEVQRDACGERKYQIAQVRMIMKGNVDLCNNIVKHGKDEEVLYLEEMIRKRLIKLQSKNITTLTMKWHPPDIRYRNVFLTIDRIGLFEMIMAREFGRRPDAPLCIGSQHVAGFRLVRRINLSVPKEDQYECRTTGLGCLYGDHIVIGDQENRKIKIFTKLGNYVETVVNFKPFGMAVCEDVVGATDNMSLNLYTNDKTIKKKISLESTGSGYPMASMLDKYLVVVNSKNATFQMYDLRGELVQDIVPVKGSKIRNPVFVATNSKGHLIVSDWLSNCLIVMDQSGKTVTEFKLKMQFGKSDWLPGSICCDQFDNIFVSDYSRSRIIVLNPRCELMFEYPTRSDGLDRPRCLTSDGNGHLLVSGKGGYLNMYACVYI